MAQPILFSFAGGMSPPPIPVVRGWINMLSHHYPERMGKAIAINVPWILNQVRQRAREGQQENLRRRRGACR